jgi:formate C-acetyltransferase
MGCVEMMLQGTMPNWGGGTGLDFPAILELVFRNGEENMIGEKGIETGDLESFKTFEDFMKAYEAQIRFALLSKRPGIAANAAQKSHFSDPFSSIWIEDCLERGRDVFRGGSRFSHVRACGGFGLGTATDALSAIKTFVFDERRITLPELWRAMQNNYREQDELRRMLESGTPCFGNDNDEVDQIARRVFDVFADTVHSMNGPDIPGKFTISVFSYNHHVYAGEAIEAMPNGRPRSEPISDAIGPSQGRDQRGPSCLINSITKLDHRKVTGAYAFNMRFTESVVKGQTGSETLKSVIRTLFAKGGVQVQINVADDKALLEARDHPEKHADWVVRVAGYSEFFVNLDRRLQDEIIRRTAHAV